MLSNLITPPDIVNNGSHSVLLVDPGQPDVDAIIQFCRYSQQAFNVYVYTPNMNNADWLQLAVKNSDVIIVNSRSNDYHSLCLLDKTYYYGDKVFFETQRKIVDPLQYFAAHEKLNK